MSDNKHRNRLALTYLSIIMVLSIGFSFGFYRESTRAANAGFDRQAGQLGRNLYFTTPGWINSINDEGKENFKERVISRLVFLNLAMLVGGTMLSVYLAKKSLLPMEEALAKQSRFTADAAHELRTPLTALKTETEIALRAKKMSVEEARQILSSNLEELNKLQTLTDSLLKLASNNGGTESRYKNVRITEVISDAAKTVIPFAKKGKLPLICRPKVK